MIIIASDGIFEFLTNQSVVDICAKFSDPLEACKAVVTESYNLWVQYELRTDDITIICMFVEPITEASVMRKDFVTSSIEFNPKAGQNKAIEESLGDAGGERPVRNHITKEKSDEIDKQKAVLSEEDLAVLNREVDLDALYTEKTASEKARISDAIKTSVMFRNITDDERELIYGVMEPITVKKGDWVIKQGTVGDRFYIIDEGTFEVRISNGIDLDNTGGNIVHLYEGSISKHLHPIFGELALMHSAPRSASVIARTDGVLFGLHRSAFRSVLAQAQGTRKELMKTISRIPLFRDLDHDEISKLAVAFNEMAFGRGEHIVEQNHFGDSMFVMTSGTCESVKVLKGTPESSTLKAGDNFGGEVILDRQKYSATVVSLQTVTGWKIDREVLTKTVPVEKLRRSLNEN